MPHVGAPLKRPDDPRLLTGRGRYVDDITLPRMVHVAFVRSPHAHAAITRIDVSAAAKSPGVVGVLTGVEAARLCRPYRGILRHYHGMKTGAMTPLALERVRCVGEPVVAIAAETAAAAHDAAARVRVDYAPLPAVLDPDSVTAPLIHPELGDNIIYETSMRGGEPDAAFAAAPRVWRGRFTTGRHTGVPMEPRGLVADFEPATRALTVWISTQVPHMMQAVLAGLFDLTEHRVRVIAPDVGGSFGIKIHVYQDDLAAVALALRLGRAVKFVATRRESFVSDIHAREQTIDVEVAGGDDGVVTAMRARIVAAVGPYSAYPRSSVVEGGQVLRMLPGPYRVRHYAGTLRVVAQNKVITSQYRAVGHPIAAAVTESMLDLIARDVALDPAEVRRRNLVRPADLALGRGPLAEPRHADRRQRDLARGPRSGRADPRRGGDAAGGAPGRHPAQRRARRRKRRARSRHDAGRPRADRALPQQRAEGARAESGGDGPLHERPAVDVHQRRPSGRRGGGYGDRSRERPALRGRRRLRPRRQSRARGGPDRGRRRAGARRRPHGALRLRRRRPAALRHADGLRGADGGRRAAPRAAPPRDAGALDRRRLQGRRRGRHHRRARGDSQRRQRRARSVRRDDHGSTDHGRARRARGPRGGPPPRPLMAVHSGRHPGGVAMAVKALLHYALEIPDQTVGEKFYTGFGLVDEPGRDGAVRLRPALLTRETVLLYGGPKKRLHHVAFGAPGAEFEATRESLRRAGVSQVDTPRGATEGGLWVRDPAGNLVNVRPEAGETPPADPPPALNR